LTWLSKVNRLFVASLLTAPRACGSRSRSPRGTRDPERPAEVSDRHIPTAVDGPEYMADLQFFVRPHDNSPVWNLLFLANGFKLA
jgi:hypothetical protein